jgi:glycerol-3-phosphate dehydrogenase (NAD(P)+)
VSAVTSEAVREAARFVVAAGGQEATMLGLAGNGDLLAAMAQEGRPEVIVGRTLASGKSVEEAEKAIGQRVVAPELPRFATDEEERVSGDGTRGGMRHRRRSGDSWHESAI